jgi:hypothetical protein
MCFTNEKGSVPVRRRHPIHIVAGLMDRQAGSLAWAATRVKIKRTSEKLHIVRTDGVTRTLGRQILGPKNDHA